MPLLHVIQVLKIKLHFVKNVSVNFNQKRPLERDIELDLQEQGILLKFDPKTQRLKVSIVTSNNGQTTWRRWPVYGHCILCGVECLWFVHGETTLTYLSTL